MQKLYTLYTNTYLLYVLGSITKNRFAYRLPQNPPKNNPFEKIMPHKFNVKCCES